MADHLEAGETSTAYASLCRQARGEFTPAEFGDIVGARPKIASHHIVSAFVRNINGKTSATADAEWSTPTAAPRPTRSGWGRTY
jgi:hypothetical protein